MGEHDLSANNDGAKAVKVKKIHQHKSYSSSTLDYDFSILELEVDLEFSESVRPACLPEIDTNDYVGLDGKFQTKRGGISIAITTSFWINF